MAERKKENGTTGTRRGRTEPSENQGNGPGEDKEAGDWLNQKAEVIDRLLSDIESQFQSYTYKASIGDFIRLLELRKELEEERPREITVTWVEPSETEDVRVS